MEMNTGAGRRTAPHAARWTLGRAVALLMFGLIALAAPLAFGAVDRLPQIVLLVLLTIGIIAQPPAVVPLSPWGNRLAIAFVALLLFKEFAPAVWFGETSWRMTMTHGYSLALPATHHPEPSRALEVILSGVVAVVWFLWVRRLSAVRENRPILAGMLFGAAAIVAIVAFATRDPGSMAIYGLRYTRGWSGFGPFPNRNHSADFFAMAAVVGCGCLTYAALRRRWIMMILGVIPLVLVVVALLFTESRGGLVAFAAGLGSYLLLCVLKMRSRRALGAAIGAALFFGALALTFGSQVFARFHSRLRGAISTDTRLQIWQDTLGMWQDAPLLGHGLGSFASLFPLYQKIEMENQIAIHPESSWLLWLVELGAIPVLVATAAAALFLGRHLRASFATHRSFFLRAGGFAAGAVLLVHALIDVPAHRWGTAGFALAALALACPMPRTGHRAAEPRQAALVPLAIAAFWMLPFIWSVPAWSPTSLIRLVTRAAVPGLAPLEELREGLRHFPLNTHLHQEMGLRLLHEHRRSAPAMWQRHFAIAARLEPSSWSLSMAQARAVQRVSPSLALPYWQEAVARGGLHREANLATAYEATAASPAARSAWNRYVEAHPQLLLTYALIVPEAQGRYYFGRWWKARARAGDLSATEIRDFYIGAARWGTPEQFEEWCLAHPERRSQDVREWAALLHGWQKDMEAWQLLVRVTADPAWPAAVPVIARDQLEARWRIMPDNFVNAQQLATLMMRLGEADAAEEIVLTVAAGAGSPKWFVDKAAHILAGRDRTREAVALLLRPR